MLFATINMFCRRWKLLHIWPLLFLKILMGFLLETSLGVNWPAQLGDAEGNPGERTAEVGNGKISEMTEDNTSMMLALQSDH